MTAPAPARATPEAACPEPSPQARYGPRWQRAFLTPLVAVLALTTVVPLLYTVVLSLGTPAGELGLSTPQGLGNYAAVFSSGAFWQSIGLIVVFLVGALALELVLGIFTAMLLDRLVPGGSLVRMLLLWPAVLPPIAVALVFKFLLQGDIGLVSYYLGLVGIEQAWLTSAASAMAVIIGIDVWQYTPFVILLTLAALTAVPDDVREAAALDGAGPIAVARRIVLPMITPAILSVALLRFIDAIQVFPTIYALTRGGPGTSTQLLTYYNYQLFFGELQFGTGAAVAVVVVVFTVACVGLLLAWQRRVEARL
ncbi:carbohydrate ABC transporter permease [Pseudonocardia sp. DLS-67]